MLEKHEAGHAELEQTYAGLVDMLLNAFVSRVPPDSPLQVQLRLLLLRLSPPLSTAELTTLRNCLLTYFEQVSNVQVFPPELAEQALVPALDSTQQLASSRAAASLTLREEPQTDNSTLHFVERRRVPRLQATGTTRVDSVYRQHLNEKKDTIQKIQNSLASQINDARRQNEEFGVLLDVELEALRQADSQQELELLRKTLIAEVEKLYSVHQSFASRLDSTQKYLELIEADSQQLSDELTRVHLLSLTDDLTDLPNRRAFMRRLEDEVGRVQRYGNELPLVLIDIDGFKQINDKYGHPFGDKVLRVYARNILSIFRHHDMVARYGGEEFAVLLPNTDKGGAMSAVAKVQRRTAEQRIEHNGAMIPVPTFSAGLALYQSGETPTDIIERADNALYRAKHQGRNRIELAPEEDLSPKPSPDPDALP